MKQALYALLIASCSALYLEGRLLRVACCLDTVGGNRVFTVGHKCCVMRPILQCMPTCLTVS